MWGKRPLRTARANKTACTPSLERLEAREVPTVGIALAGGVLTVTGTTSADTITLVQSSTGYVGLSGSTKTFAASTINSIVINDNSGNDTVSVTGLGSNWTKAITINSSAGDETAKLLDGRALYFNGAYQQAQINGTGGPVTINGRTPDWFDFNIHDAALRQILRTDDADGALDRSDMLGVFKQVDVDGVVSANEFVDLKAVANTTTLFGSSDAVAELTRNLALGNVANAHYQGSTLGNLYSGEKSTGFDKLVNKWFRGADHPNAYYAGTTGKYVVAAGTLFGANGPQYVDVDQGVVGDCYFVATLGEVALRSQPTIQNMFIVNGDGTYMVRFYQNGVSHYVTVDSQLPTYLDGTFMFANYGLYANSSSNVLWVALAEKAYAQINEEGWLRPSTMGGGKNSYAAIEGGYFDDAAAQIANRTGTDYAIGGSSDATLMANSWNTGKLIGHASKLTPADPRILGNHEYVVVGYNSSTQTVTLFNPWGINNGTQYPGLIDLSLSQLSANFDFWSVA